MPGDGYRLIAHGVDHRGPAVAWELCEDERPGQFDVDEARRLGVPEGPAFGELQRGEQRRRAADGSVIEPGAVVGPARRGRTRRLQRRHASLRARCAAPRSAPTCSCTRRASPRRIARARSRRRHSTAAEAAELAAASEVKLLALTHLGARATPRDDQGRGARGVREHVVPRDFDTIELPLPERGAPELRRGGAHPEEEKAP